jgi:16S rRNA (guanine527-N7)-methyltransferase
LEDRLIISGVGELLRQTSNEMGVSLRDSQIELFELYLQTLLEWNKTFNLTGIRDPEDIVIKHFVDSLTPLPYLEPSGRLLDLGPGAGFPSIPLKIAAGELKITLVEASRKKVSFLKHIIRTLKLESVVVQHSRFELMEPADLPFNTIISRAFTRLEPLVKLVAPIMTPGSTLVAMLGPARASGHSGFADFAQAESLELHRMVSLELPRGRGGRTLLFFTKL